MAIKFLVFFIYFFICANVSCLPPITGLKVTYLEPLGIYVQWDVPYRSIHDITGYKIKLWSVEEKTSRNYKLLNGDQYPGLERNDIAQEPFNAVYMPKGNVKEIIRNNAYHNEARFLNIVVNKLYEIRVSSYKDEELGPMTDPVRVKILKSKTDYTMSEKVVKPRPKYMVLAQSRLDSCGVSIISNSSDGEPYIHNTYL